MGDCNTCTRLPWSRKHRMTHSFPWQTHNQEHRSPHEDRADNPNHRDDKREDPGGNEQCSTWYELAPSDDVIVMFTTKVDEIGSESYEPWTKELLRDGGGRKGGREEERRKEERREGGRERREGEGGKEGGRKIMRRTIKLLTSEACLFNAGISYLWRPLHIECLCTISMGQTHSRRCPLFGGSFFSGVTVQLVVPCTTSVEPWTARWLARVEPWTARWLARVESWTARWLARVEPWTALEHSRQSTCIASIKVYVKMISLVLPHTRPQAHCYTSIAKHVNISGRVIVISLGTLRDFTLASRMMSSSIIVQYMVYTYMNTEASTCV